MAIRTPADYAAAVQQALTTVDRLLAMAADFGPALSAREQLTRLGAYARANQPPPRDVAEGLTLSLLAVREFDDQHPALAYALREIEAAAEAWAGVAPAGTQPPAGRAPPR